MIFFKYGIQLLPLKKRTLKMVHTFTLAGVSLVIVGLAGSAYGQTTVSGSITGKVMDPQGGVLPSATVTVTDIATGSVLKVTTNADGQYTAPLLKPDIYKVSAEGAGLQSDSTTVEVPVGGVTTADLKVSPKGSAQTVQVSASLIPLIDTTTSALVTSFDERQIQQLPAPGGDISTIAFTVPGVLVNAGGEFGNFTIYGLPAISNLFVLNGFDDVDPFLNLNNSGSSNLTLGQAELAESSVITNSYNTQYGRVAGAVVTYVTKSGGNQFHGLVNYYWNGDILNANDWFRNENGEGRERSVSNQWAVQLGGPIKKDKLWFFSDYEGLHYVLPASGPSVFPTAAFQSYILGQIPSQSTSLYKQAFALYQAAPYYSKSTPTVNAPIVNGSPSPVTSLQDGNETLGCGEYGFAGTPTGKAHQYWGSVPASDPTGSAVACTQGAIASASNLNQEFLWTWRVDWKINDKNTLFGRAKMDHGTQPTFTDFSAPIFNTISKQPEYEGQLNDTYIITPQMTNQFVFAADWYTAYFGPSNLPATLAAYPTFLEMFDAGPSESGFGSLGMPNAFPQGRNVTGYQFVDDVAYIKGKSTYKFGVNFRRSLISLYDAQTNVDGGAAFFDLPDFVSGQFPNDGISAYSESFTTVPDVHIGLYNMGVYFMDDYKANKRLTLSGGVRMDRTGNPQCKESCFTEYSRQYTQAISSAGLTQNYYAPGAYSSLLGGSVSTVNKSAFPSVDVVNFQPRGGIVYDVFGNSKTVLRGGIGLFTDLYPGVILDNVIQNFPSKFNASVIDGVFASSGTGSNFNQAIAQNKAVQSGFSGGQDLYQIANTLLGQNAVLAAPSFGALAPHQFHNPQYLEWNVQLQQQITPNDVIDVGYVGNKGTQELFFNPDLNASSAYFNQNANAAYDYTASCVVSDPSNPNFGSYTYCYPGGFKGVPQIGADANFGAINALTNAGYSNYNGLLITLKHRDHHGLHIEGTYTWSHALDLISNGGANGSEPFNAGAISGALTPYAPYNLNYSNADYDVRNDFSMDALWDLPYKFHTALGKAVLEGWSVSAKSYYRSGEPFSVTDVGEAGSIGPSYGGNVAAQEVVPYKPNCSYLPEKIVHSGCLNFNNYALDPVLLTTSQYYYNAGYTTSEDTNVEQTSLGNVRRNSYYGPHYADTDLMVSKSFLNVKKMNFLIGATSFNVFNHPNFGQPNWVLDGGAGSLGFITSAISPPTSPYGSFQGAAVTGRLVQVFGKFSF